MTGAVLLACFSVTATLLLGAYLVAVLDAALAALLGSGRCDSVWLAPLRRGAWLWLQADTPTEHPDAAARRLAPALYLALAAVGIALVPWSATLVPVDLPTGLVLWGAVEALTTVVVFLHGWAANAPLPQLGAYRYVALGLSYILISMFVLIAVALPAESLRLAAVVESQRELWNVLRQPLGLPLFLLVGLGITFWGPLNFADADDLAGGTAADSSGVQRLVWEVARCAMLVAVAAIAATAFLGGWLGPGLPGPLWLLLKSAAVLALLLLLGRVLARPTPERFVTWAWLVLLPVAFLDLLWAGVLALPG